MWLLFSVLTATVSGQSLDVTYTTHLDDVVTGFDPFCMNCFIQPDPGRRSTIFQPLQSSIHSADDEVIINQFINEAEESKCFLDLTIQTVTNYIELQKYAASSSYQISSDVNYASPEVRYGNSASCETKSNSRDRAMRQFFEDTGGEVILVSAECVTHTITIDPFEPLMFAPAFETALVRLCEAALNPAPETSDKTFADFVWSYGTHFSKRSQLGSRAVLGKLFSSRAATVKEETTRRGCVLEAAREALTPCMRRCNETTLTHFARASSERCGETEHEVLAIITGPLPVRSNENWSSVAEELPDPIYHYLEPISTLFTRQWSSSVAEIMKINKIILHHFFVNKLADYSNSMLTTGLDRGQTSVLTTGLDRGQTEVRPASIPLTKYGGVIIIGGWAALNTCETLGTPELPSFPDQVWGNTVSIVGSTVFSCGGYQSEKRKICYYLRAEDPTWRSIALPWPLSHHSAVTVQDTTIWFLQDSTLYSFDTAKDSAQFREYSLRFTFRGSLCAVSNQSHTFVILTEEGRNEVWVNKDPSKPTEWEKVANVLDGRYGLACLWFGNDIFVTGGKNIFVPLDSVNILNLTDMTVRSTGPLGRTRARHHMAVLHGKPAVLGGEVEDRASSSIEVYELTTDTWQELNYTMKEKRERFGLAQYRH